jgi:hypothetical protein
MAHKFKIGQVVDLDPSVLQSLVPGPYEIRHLIPSSDRDPGDPCYRIKSAAENYERAAPEGKLTLSVGVSPFERIQKCFLGQNEVGL